MPLGQQVHLRDAAYLYQKFGLYRGTVKGTVVGVPCCEKRLRIAMRTYNSATWRSKSPAITSSASSLKQRILTFTKLRRWYLFSPPLYADDREAFLAAWDNRQMVDRHDALLYHLFQVSVGQRII